ncbi:MAG: oligosaccharide flippase family protein [Terriglobales bacterium]
MRPFDEQGAFRPIAPAGGGLRQAAVRSVGVTLLSGGVGLAIQIVAAVVLARLLAPRDFGLMTMVTTFSLLLLNFGMNGITEAVVQREVIDQYLASNLFWINVGGSLVLAIGFAAAGPLLTRLYHDSLITGVTEGVSLTIFITGLSVLHLALLKRAMRFSVVSLNDIIGRIVLVVSSIALAWAGWGYWALVVGVVAQCLSVCIGSWVGCRWIPSLPRRHVGTGAMIRFAISTYARFSTGYFTNNLDNFLVGWRLGPATLGFYKKAYDLFALPTYQLATNLTIVAVSALSRLQSDWAQYRRYLLSAIGVAAFVGMGLGADLTLVGRDLILVLLGPKWEESGRLFVLFGPGIGIMMLYSTHIWIHLSIGRADRWFRWGLIDLVVTTLSLLVGLHWGAEGIAVAWVVSYWVIAFPALWYAGQPIKLGISSIIATVWRYILASLLAGGISALFLPAMRSFVGVDPSWLAAARRVVTVSLFFGSLYLGAVILLHWGTAPLRQFAGLVREMISRNRPANPAYSSPSGSAMEPSGTCDVFATTETLIPKERVDEPIIDRIPRRIIQTGKSGQQSLLNRAGMANARLLNPDYEYLFFDDEQVQKFMDQEAPKYREVFRSFRAPIQRFDFFRYLAVYRYGGFYLDLDVLLSSGLSELLSSGCVFPFEGLTFSKMLRERYHMDWNIGNYAFGAAPEHPFLEAVIENCIRAQKDPGWVEQIIRGVPPLSRRDYRIFYSTGPGLISRTLAENKELARTVTVMFPDDVRDVNNWNQFGSLGVHLMEGSWRPRSNWLRKRAGQYWELWRLQHLVKQARKLGKTRYHLPRIDYGVTVAPAVQDGPQPLVSILIPAYNAEESIANTLRSALAQTWKRKEIIVVDDGSSDQTLAIARQFEAEGVQVVTQENQGATIARNKAFALSQGDYIQWLDADDLLAPDKIARQMQVVGQGVSKRALLSSAWGLFMYRPYRAEFIPTALWCDLSPTEWLQRKMERNIYMQTATWLVSRELTEAAGPWDTRLLGDDDGEYFCRVLLASEGVHFVPQSKVYYRGPGIAFGGLSHIGQSDRRIEAHWLSMQLHIKYLRSLEDSDRVRTACLRYLQTSLIHFYPEKAEIVRQAKEMARDLGGQLKSPVLSWKYSWMKAIFGWHLAKHGQQVLLKLRWKAAKWWDRTVGMSTKDWAVPYWQE